MKLFGPETKKEMLAVPEYSEFQCIVTFKFELVTVPALIGEICHAYEVASEVPLVEYSVFSVP